MRRPFDLLLLPGPGRATRSLRVTRLAVWLLAMLTLAISLLAVAAGFFATDAVMGGLSSWASP